MESACCSTSCANKGGSVTRASPRKAIPITPSAWKSMIALVSDSTSPNCTCFTTNPPHVKSSVDFTPLTTPLPYLSSNDSWVLLYDVENLE
jgi:hypothetical protein